MTSCHTSGSRALFTGLTILFFQQFFQKKNCPTTLFVHLKIILLQCFQFSVFNKISGIQTDPKNNKLFNGLLKDKMEQKHETC